MTAGAGNFPRLFDSRIAIKIIENPDKKLRAR
jgi:hypothetical protein